MHIRSAKLSETAHLELIEPTNLILNSVSHEVALQDIPTPAVQGLIDRMLELAAGKGHSKHDSRQMVGLAAPQLGVTLRIILIDLTADGSNKPQHLQEIINPTIVQASDETVPGREGCWSCGNICGIVESPKHVILQGYDRNGEPIKLELEGFVARIARHETDHLNGVRFPDWIPASEPQKLHWVKPVEFESYRKNWAHWRTLCPREHWEELKSGRQIGD